ncbi:hypothetical protein [Chelativorans sp.]|uniref:hypothetical protein n=1 Tax=Chelativorans sp. TaxID=2203393 RepID=UPI002810DF6E|nr:hypothetical protein [Chelativorans sp.]
MLGAMQSASGKNDPRSTDSTAAPAALPALDKDMLAFVEALAVADARRDHLASIRHPAPRDPASESAGQTSEMIDK